jgi:hypothetical protein
MRTKVLGSPACDLLMLSPVERRQARAMLSVIEGALGIQSAQAAPDEAASLE